MSLTFTVGTRTGTLPGAGDNGNQEIDTKGEAEDALATLGSDDSGTFGSKTYTRKELEAIRDGKGGGSAGSARGEGVSHGAVIKGGYAFGTGDKGHGGGLLRFGYEAGIWLLGSSNSSQLDLDLSAQFQAGNRKAEFTTPGGEKTVSAYTPIGGLIETVLRFRPNFADHRIGFGAGFNVGISSFFTDDSKSVSLPASCVPGDFGRGECEPTAGPRTGNSGKAGLQNFDLGAARGTSGLHVYTGFPINITVDAVKASWGTLRPILTFEPGLNFISPSDGHGFSHVTLATILGIGSHFGGSAAYGNKAPDFDQDGVPDSLDKCPGTPLGTKVDATGCPATGDTQKEPVPISPGAGDVPIPQGYQF